MRNMVRINQDPTARNRLALFPRIIIAESYIYADPGHPIHHHCSRSTAGQILPGLTKAEYQYDYVVSSSGQSAVRSA